MSEDPHPDPELDQRTGRSAAFVRMQNQTQWVDLQLRQAAERGDFDDLPGYGKPIENLGRQHDPDWWLKQLIEREQITGVLPPALQLRKDDLELDDLLDRQSVEKEARRLVEEFNARIIHARYSQHGGPALITMPRDVDETLQGWRERRAARAEEPDNSAAAGAAEAPARRWWQRRRRT